MKKHLTLLAVAMLCAVISFAQDGRKGYLGIALGPSIPLSPLADKIYDQEDAGYADNGLYGMINFYYIVSENIGVTAMWFGAAYPLDEATYSEHLEILTNQNSSINSDPWVLGGIMVGPLISIPKGKVNIDFRAMIGFIRGTYPKQYINVGANTLQVNETSSSSVGFDLGTGLRINATNGFAINLTLDYIMSKIKYDIELIDPYKQGMDNLSIGIGFGVRLK